VFFSGHTDSDTGYMDTLENRTNRKKTRRKRTTNLGPRLKVLNINPMDSGLKVECQMETAKQKTITFEFSTVDIVPDDISAEFVSFRHHAVDVVTCSRFKLAPFVDKLRKLF
jgi:hypothetical protein